MIPLRDNIPSRTTPVVNYAIIGACTAAFLLQLAHPDLTERLAMIPARVTHGIDQVLVHDIVEIPTRRGIVERATLRQAQPALVPEWLTLLTCTFLHGGWLHFLGNMWFLWIFGDNVEDRLGHAGYAGFYLAWGVLASGTHLALSTGSNLPTVGASGAIAGVMGAYLLLYPHALVQTLVPLYFILQVLVLPAWLFLGIWFAIQLLQGSFAIGNLEAGGVAWWAHIGGFVAGAVTVLALRNHGLRPPVGDRRLRVDRMGSYRLRGRHPFD
ncbi:MAG: rhomboid family intramembrane serine protease [Planctomycetota bacterium]